MTKFILSFVCFLALVCLANGFLQDNGLQRMKRLGGPPSDFADLALPKPEDVVNVATSILYPLSLGTEDQEENQVYHIDMIVDSPDSLVINIVTEHPESVVMQAFAPSSATVPVEPVTTGVSSFGLGETQFPCMTFYFVGIEVGNWDFVVSRSHVDHEAETTKHVNAERGVLQHNQDVGGWQTDSFFFADNEGTQSALHSHLTTFNLTTGNKVGMRAFLYSKELNNGEGGFHHKIDQALMDIRDPDGHVVTIAMYDDGLHDDAEADDGIYGANFLASEHGSYTAEVFFQADMELMRSTFTSFHICAPAVKLTGNTAAWLVKRSDPTWEFSEKLTAAEATSESMAVRVALEVDYVPTMLKQMTNKLGEFRIYMEVWAKTESDVVPVSWTGGIVDVEPIVNRGDLKDTVALTVDIDTEWFVHAKVKPSQLVLKNIRVQSTESGWTPIVMDVADVSILTYFTDAKMSVFERTDGHVSVITPSMLEGPKPSWLHKRGLSAIEEGVEVQTLLVHGYCSAGIPFPLGDFNNPLGFEDFEHSRSNDEFAQLIIEFTEQENAKLFGIISHSQGGLASTHMLSYYWSDLDNYGGDRFVQSLCSPYSGSSAAGTLAALSEKFSKGCGANDDLSVEGAALWMSGVPMAVRDYVYYYYTTYPKSAGIGKRFCNLASQSQLNNPNDGAVELEHAHLDGAHDMGLTEGECHVGGMKWPASYENHARNAEMSSYIQKGSQL